MLKILNKIRLRSVKLDNQVDRGQIFCFDFILGFSMLSIMLSILSLLGVYKPFFISGFILPIHLVLFPWILFLGLTVFICYDDCICRNMNVSMVTLLVMFGVLAKLIANLPSPQYYDKSMMFKYIFKDSVINSIIISAALFFSQSLLNTLYLFIQKNMVDKLHFLKCFSFVISSSISLIILQAALAYLSPVFSLNITECTLIYITNGVFSVVLYYFSIPFSRWIFKNEKIKPYDTRFEEYRYGWLRFNVRKKNYIRLVVGGENFNPIYKCNYLCALAMIYMLFMILSGMTVYKILDLWGVTIPVAVLSVPFIYGSSNVITEVYGFPVARNMIWWYVVTSFIFTSLSLVLSYMPGNLPTIGIESYHLVLGSMPIIFIAGTIGTFIAMNINNQVVSKLKRRLDGYHYWFRSLVSTAGGELVYNAIAYPIMFFGTMSLYNFIGIVVNVSMFKLLMTAVICPLECFFVVLLKKAERINVFDFDVNYSVFRTSIRKSYLKNSQ